MVRLKVEISTLIAKLKELFQFLDGAIKRYQLNQTHFQLNSFNSLMVRLKDADHMLNYIDIITFQFLDGAIKSQQKQPKDALI